MKITKRANTYKNLKQKLELQKIDEKDLVVEKESQESEIVISQPNPLKAAKIEKLDFGQ